MADTPSLTDSLIPLQGAENVRDLGGYAVVGGGTTQWRRVLRGDGLHALTPDDLRSLHDLGVRSVIDLRGPAELARQPSPYATRASTAASLSDGTAANPSASPSDGISYANVPLFEKLSPIDMAVSDGSYTLLGRYLEAIDQCGTRIAEVLTRIAVAEPGVVLFHCTVGKDRTGLIAGLLLSLVGVAPDTVVEDYALTERIAGPLLAGFRAAALERGLPPAQVDELLSSPPAAMAGVLAHIDARCGGVAAYLTANGVDATVQERLKERLTR